MNPINNLSQNSVSYYEENHIYQLFSDAEDYPNYAYQAIFHLFNNKTVLDLGCGNGKYIKKLLPHVQNIIGLDLSLQQLERAKENCSSLLWNDKLKFIQSDACSIPLENESVDIILSAWMFGTILDKEKQLNAMNEAKRILKKGGQIILLENAGNCQFEILRGRSSDKDNRTKEYNNWLISQEFFIYDSIDTYFQFDSKELAQNVFYSIWKDRLIGIITNAIITHSIRVYSYKK